MRVCMLAYTYYDMDNRVRRYAEALAKRGDHVDVVALCREGETKQNILHGVNVYRIQKRILNEKGKLSYLKKILMFLIKSGVFVTTRHSKEPYDLIHVHSVPDFEVFSAFIPKLKGAKVILDIHDIVPEFYASKFRVSEDSMVFKALKLIERVSVAFSDHTIIANHIWQERLLSRSIQNEKCSVFLNYPDPAIFYRRTVEKDPDRLIFMYPGTLSWHQGLDIALKAFSQIKDEVKTAEFHIYGDGPERNNLERLATELGIRDRVLFKGLISMDEVSEVMARGDVGVVPKRNDSFGGEAFSTKIFEFMALGIPVIVSATIIDKYYFNDSVVQFFEPENINDLAKSMLLLGKGKERRAKLTREAFQFVRQYSWDQKKQEYFDLVDGLAQNRGTVKFFRPGFKRHMLKIYYHFKPIVPKKLQIQMRRRVALRKRLFYQDSWPIDEKAAKIPAGWPGWPDKKRFALVLTHDVEGNRGLSKCLQVAELEEGLGFRSSFNFVAEGYQVSEALLNDLRIRGFEAGLHGLKHRGNLFESRKRFQRQIDRINGYLEKWGASGFRCPSMYHNLGWIRDLHIDYDSSTFDTDPFEPQPDGVGTIFPFIVGGTDSQKNYVELPYTVPQDHLLFVVMKEKTIDIWKKKLDWVAEKGGMALLITHPDYMKLDHRGLVDEYPVEYYREFLQYVKTQYEGQYWHALPKEVASFAKDSKSFSEIGLPHQRTFN